MTKEKFDEKYRTKGGLDMLRIMTHEKFLPIRVIGNHYGLSAERIRQLMVELFGWHYDPRFPRREKKINNIITIIKNTNVTDIKQISKMFKGMNYSYISEAINRTKNENK